MHSFLGLHLFDTHSILFTKWVKKNFLIIQHSPHAISCLFYYTTSDLKGLNSKIVFRDVVVRIKARIREEFKERNQLKLREMK
ncbi:unnamed protein product [Citrullus colocynthis]|uniref:Uncharacterized protein n=1 Tax=Citrullus colocynthis TaxID=252529 RepID=A0ABP0XLK9_9ROSI